ncbi:hypothetical protein PSOLE_38660 [Pseudomonas oleovorans subsp. oleovorans]|jgi:hypothetical protein|uniref:TniA protein n=1 Tax=Ectopseudomonas oleovorans TaxID=301 RepID=A0A379PL07_ECTOL|nr:hypothetical protein PSOLE_38660 [Pseudomonas oleovorans subsp. oleovorans]SEK02285.1 hypothetical protein SAMN05216280_11018 [Pseudomonas oleovorans]SUE72639.1 TniA protein [Pseudomonas oleovorans]
MHLSIHQRAAVIWLLASPIVFAPTLQIAKRPDAGLFLAQGIALVTIMIAVVPMLLKWPRFLWDANKVSSLEIKCHPEQSGSGLVRPWNPQ